MVCFSCSSREYAGIEISMIVTEENVVYENNSLTLFQILLLVGGKSGLLD